MGSNPQPLDGGWGWVIVVCSTINHAGTVGLFMSFSVLYVSWLDQFGAGKSMTSWVISVGVACMFGLSPIPANLVTRLGFRTVGFIGGILTCAGLTMGAFARSISHLIVAIGFVAGIGCCFSYLPGVAMVALYFDKRRSLAMGIATMGTGIGAFGFAPLLDMLERTYGWRGALLLMGAISLHMSVTGMLMRPLGTYGNRREEDVVVGSEDSDDDTEFSGSVEGREKTRVSLHATEDVVHPYDCRDDEGTSVVNPDNFIPPQIMGTSKRDGTHFHEGVNDKNVDGCCISDLLFASVNGEIVGIKYDSNGGKHKCCHNCMQRSIDTINTQMITHNACRVFTSLDDFSPTKGKGWHQHHVSLPNFKSAIKSSNKRMDNVALGDIRNFDIHSLHCIQNVLSENTEQNENRIPFLSTDIEKCTLRDANTENSRKTTSLIHRCLSSSTIRLNYEMLQDKRFLAFAFSNLLNNFAFIACVVHLVDRAVFQGIDKSVGAIIISANGLGNIFGRICVGWLANRFCSDHLLMYISTLVVCGIGTILSPLCGQVAVLHGIFAAFFGCMMGMYVILASLVTAYMVDMPRVARAYGLVLFFMGPATVVGAPFAGWLFDRTKSYVMSYVVNGVFLLVSGVMLLPFVCGAKKR